MTISRHQAVGAYRRWEPVDFDAPETPAAAELPVAPAALDPAAIPQAPEPEPDPLGDVQLPTAEDIERMHEEARAAGHAEGYAAGHAAGFEAGREAGHAEGAARVEEAVRRLTDLSADLDKALSQLDQEVAEELMALSIEIARQMVQHTLAVHPETVLQTVRNALLQIQPGLKGQIDRFGGTPDGEIRYMIAPYKTYKEEREFDAMDRCATRRAKGVRPDYYRCFVTDEGPQDLGRRPSRTGQSN